MKTARGSLHIVVSIVIVVAIAGALGYLFMKNNLVGDTGIYSDPTSGKNAETDNRPETFCLPEEKLCFSNPDGWIVDINSRVAEISNVAADRGTVTSPREEGLELYVLSGIDGSDGWCEPGMQGRVYVEKIRKLDETWVANGDDGEHTTEHLYVVAYIEENREKTSYTPIIMLTKSKPMTTTGAKDGCSATLSYMFNAKNVSLATAENFNEAGDGATSLGMEFSTLRMHFGDGATGNDNQQKTLAEAKQLLETADYVQAFDILASAHYK